jgi:hypothetical protein
MGDSLLHLTLIAETFALRCAEKARNAAAHPNGVANPYHQTMKP